MLSQMPTCEMKGGCLKIVFFIVLTPHGWPATCTSTRRWRIGWRGRQRLGFSPRATYAGEGSRVGSIVKILKLLDNYDTDVPAAMLAGYIFFLFLIFLFFEILVLSVRVLYHYSLNKMHSVSKNKKNYMHSSSIVQLFLAVNKARLTGYMIVCSYKTRPRLRQRLEQRDKKAGLSHRPKESIYSSTCKSPKLRGQGNTLP